eukprot:TRINITY_DN40877_c0_g1_i1.p1 TRINITY_DN40877_c0_g1~~TRINITY_DN40877_c0_g1_i1.p1  ORF type:complete len:308 (+),score=31.36 TRINITY_DN40877_c0_g1_i1:118-1041(+)
MGCGAGTAYKEAAPCATETACQVAGDETTTTIDGSKPVSSTEDAMDLTLESVVSPAPEGPSNPSESLACNVCTAPVRILLVRHAQSACTNGGQVLDPSLSNLGTQQAQRLSSWLTHELRNAAPSGIRVVSSPMRRCLMTILPAIKSLGLPREACICHGLSYEQACLEANGSRQSDVEAEMPFSCVDFGQSGWEDRDVSSSETSHEFLLRVRRFIAWLQKHAFDFQPLADSDNMKELVLVLCMHETVMDLIVRIVVDGEDIREYDGKAKYKVKNSYTTELMRNGLGQIGVVRHNSGEHMRFAVPPMIA